MTPGNIAGDFELEANETGDNATRTAIIWLRYLKLETVEET